MTEQSKFVHGGVTYPLPTGGGNTLLRDADPSLYYVLDYFASVLQTYMGARLTADAATAGVTSIASAVGYSIPYDPALYLQEQQLGRWPLLAVWRLNGKYNWRTVARHETVATWKVAYVLPPLDSAQRELLQPVLNAAPKILLNRIENKFDPFYASGAEFCALAGLDAIDLSEDVWGNLDTSTNLSFPTWMGTLTVVERDEPMPIAATGGPFAGVDVAFDLVSPDGTVLPDLIDLRAGAPVFTGMLGTSVSMLGLIQPGLGAA